MRAPGTARRITRERDEFHQRRFAGAHPLRPAPCCFADARVGIASRQAAGPSTEPFHSVYGYDADDAHISPGSSNDGLGISLCVVNYEGEELLRDTLCAAAAASPPFREVIVVDNASRDGSIALVHREFPGVTVIALAENRGPGGARNVGLEVASGRLVLFLDNDVLLAPDCAARLARALAADPDAVIAMPRVRYRRAPDVVQYDGASSHFLGMASLEHADLPLEHAPSEVRRIDSVISACILVDRERWDRLVGGPLFDDDFFYIHEDHDLGIRTRLSGGAILSVPDAHCFHGEGTAGLSLRRTGQYRPPRIVGNIRNRWFILLKNYQVRTLVLLSPVLAVFELFQLAGVMKKGWYREWWQSVTSVVRDWNRLLAKRRAVQRARRLPDGAVLRGGRLPFAPQLAADRTERLAQAVLDQLCRRYWRVAERWL